MRNQINHFKCPKCGSENLKTRLNRKTKFTAEMWRRKKCVKCDHEFDTLERILNPIERAPEREW